MDIRKFFGVIPNGKKLVNEAVKKNEKTKSAEETFKTKKGIKEIKVNSSCKEDGFKSKQPSKKRRIIYDSDSEPEETIQVKNAKKQPGKMPLPAKRGKIPRQDPVTYVSETDEEDDFKCRKPVSKTKENGGSGKSYLGTASIKKNAENTKTTAKPLSPVKLTPTSVLDYFGSSSIQRSERMMVASKRKELPQSTAEVRFRDDAIAGQLLRDEDAELERQLHEDEEFARTLAMLDEEPKSRETRKDPEEKETSSSVQGTFSKTGKHKYPQKEQSSDDKKSCRPQERPECDRSAEPQPHSRCPPHKADLCAPKASSKPALLERQEESSHKAAKAVSSRTPRKAVDVRDKRKTPKKNQSSPAKESTSPEDLEKKRTNYQAYRSYLNREGPKALGSKEIPQGAENCLEGLTFVITGVLESIEREEAKSLIERYGGKVTGNVSKKTNYLVMGRDSGQSKSDKAAALGTSIIDEDDLLELIRTMPGRKSKYEIAVEAEMKKEKAKVERTPPKLNQGKRKISPNQKDSDSKKKNKPTPQKDSSSRLTKKEVGLFRRDLNFGKLGPEETDVDGGARDLADDSRGRRVESLLWVDKYKPTSLKTIIGQQSDQSCANKLLRWLRNWHKSPSEDKKHARLGKFAGKDDGAGFKAALLSGPPGVGKTTTASLVCQELGYSYVELNASDTRSKNSLKGIVAESLSNTSIKGFYSGGTTPAGGPRHALIMDEVDGMAGNEDRGGIQELIGLIKHTKIPIICMCNDRNHPKIRSLVHYCFDLRFQRPRLEQIKGAMMSIAFKEGLKIPPPAMNEIILGANQDIRQVLHNLSMWCAQSKALTYDQAKAEAGRARKDIKLGPFDVARKVFAAGEETAHMTLMDKSDLFFHDYSIAPLFVQENYVHVTPKAAGGDMKKHLVLLSRAADSICDGDLVDSQVRRRQNWSLLPTQAIYASVLPGELMRGYMTQFPTFPSWLGKHSSMGRHDRVVHDLALHMHLRTHASKRTVNMEYLWHLRDALAQPLASRGLDGVPAVLALMDAYCLVRGDLDTIMELGSWGGKPSPFSKLDPKVKAAFTRAYNKEPHLTPYSLVAVKTRRRSAGAAPDSEHSEGFDDDDDDDDAQAEERDADAVEADAMIQKKAKSSVPTKSEKHKEPKKGKGKSSKK